MVSRVLTSLITRLNLCGKSSVINPRIKARCMSDARVVGSRDGEVVVCWHPETKFPYENSLPLKKEIKEDLTVLREPDYSRLKFNNKKREFVIQELMDLTYTTKHRWFPKGIHKVRRTRPIERSRKYL